MALETGLAALTSPMNLFFVMGGFAGLVRSDLSVPEPIGKAMSLDLMAAIGIKGGIQVAEAGFSNDIAAALAAGIALSLLLPIPACRMDEPMNTSIVTRRRIEVLLDSHGLILFVGTVEVARGARY